MPLATESAKGTANRPTETAARFKQAHRAASLLKHLSDATRLRVILMLSEGEKHVGALCDEFG